MKIIHHGDQDGFMSAIMMGVIANRLDGFYPGPFPEMISAQYGDEVPWDRLNDREIAVVDFSFSQDVMEELASRSSKFIWVDHHISSAGMVDSLRELENTLVVHATGKSACGLIDRYWSDLYKYLHGTTNSESQVLPLSGMSDYIEDADLALYKMPSSMFVNAFVRSQPLTVQSYMWMLRRWGDSFSDIVFGGQVINDGHRTQTHKLYKTLTSVREDPDGNKVAITNTPPFLPYRIASKVSKEFELSVDYACDYAVKDGRVMLSFRSADNKMAVEPLAKKLGGGGHEHAAGAEVDLNHEYAQFVLGGGPNE